MYSRMDDVGPGYGPTSSCYYGATPSSSVGQLLQPTYTTLSPTVSSMEMSMLNDSSSSRTDLDSVSPSRSTLHLDSVSPSRTTLQTLPPINTIKCEDRSRGSPSVHNHEQSPPGSAPLEHHGGIHSEQRPGSHPEHRPDVIHSVPKCTDDTLTEFSDSCKFGMSFFLLRNLIYLYSY